MEAPEKLYVDTEDRLSDSILYGFTERRKDDDIEYVRKDAFIEKANKWLSLNIKMLMNVLDVEYDTHDTDIKDFIEDFRRYIKD